MVKNSGARHFSNALTLAKPVGLAGLTERSASAILAFMQENRWPCMSWSSGARSPDPGAGGGDHRAKGLVGEACLPIGENEG